MSEASKRLGVSADTLRWQIHKRKLRARKVGPIWTVSEREVDRYRRENLWTGIRTDKCWVHHDEVCGVCPRPWTHSGVNRGPR